MSSLTNSSTIPYSFNSLQWRHTQTQSAHLITALACLFTRSKSLLILTQNFSPWLKNKMAGIYNLLWQSVCCTKWLASAISFGSLLFSAIVVLDSITYIDGMCNKVNYYFAHHLLTLFILKEYYEIVDEACPLSGFFSNTCWFFLQKCISNHETKQASKFQSDLSSNCFTINVWNILLTFSSVYFLILSYCFFLVSHFTQVCSVLICDILGLGLF